MTCELFFGALIHLRRFINRAGLLVREGIREGVGPSYGVWEGAAK